MPYNFVANGFHTNVVDFLQGKCDLHIKRPFSVFQPLWGLRGNVQCSS